MRVRLRLRKGGGVRVRVRMRVGVRVGVGMRVGVRMGVQMGVRVRARAFISDGGGKERRRSGDAQEKQEPHT